jgi:hypothetical protein
MRRDGVDAVTAQRRMGEEERTALGRQDEEMDSYQVVLDPTVLPPQMCEMMIVAAAQARLMRPYQPPVQSAPRAPVALQARPVAATSIRRRGADGPPQAPAPVLSGVALGSDGDARNGHLDRTTGSAPADELIDRLAMALRAELARREVPG